MARHTNGPVQFHESIRELLPAPIYEANYLTITPYTAHEAWADIRATSRDIVAVLSTVGRTLTSRRMRIGALVVALCSITSGGVVAYSIANGALHQYASAIKNPAFIMNNKNKGTTITDRNGVILYTAFGAVEHHNASTTELPKSMINATLAAEDPDFYKNPGFSWRGTARAIYQDVMHRGKVQGGSTITQQLVKTTLLSSEKSFNRKFKEIVLSVELERHYNKQQILGMYLNSIYYGEGAYGVESASQTYFHKPAKELTLEQSALLAGLPQSPSVYDPTINPSAAAVRRNYVLGRMSQLGFATASDTAAAAKLAIATDTHEDTIKAPHFVFYVLDQLRTKYGDDLLKNGGITVRTSLDYAKQQAAEQIVKNQIEKLSSHHATNGGLVSMDPKTGQIISMVGSVDYYQPGFGAVNITTAQLQPGSSFKPIAYVTAFGKGWNGATEVDDKPLRLPQGDGTIYVPQNYDQKFRGPVLLRRALANSLNIPALEVLQYAGIDETITMAHSLGIQAPSLTDRSRLGLSLVLGGGEVRPIDMATVYGTFANGGKRSDPVAVISVADRYGRDITKYPVTTANNTQVLDSRLAYMITNILSDNGARTEEFGAHSPLLLSRPAAAKTGTTNDFRDNWTVGYTPDLVTAVWVGNNDHSPMSNVDGITGAAPIWHDYMEMASAGIPVHDFAVPSGVNFAKVCSSNGGLASATDVKAVNEVFLAGATPTKPCGGAPAVIQIPTPTTPLPTAQQATASTTDEQIGRGSGNGSGTPVDPPAPTPTPAPGPSQPIPPTKPPPPRTGG